MKKRFWIEVISSLFILLFLYTAISKFREFDQFRSALHGSPLIGNMTNIISWIIPSIEIIISAFLFFPKGRSIGLWSSLSLMLIFTGYITYMLFFSERIPCSCGGVIEKMTWNQHLIFNVFFTLLAALGLWLMKKNKNYNRSPQYSAVA